MTMLTGSALVALVLAALAPSALGHGYLSEPPARNSGRGPANGYCPQCGNGRGVCGDGGQFGSQSNFLASGGAPQRTYTAGEVVDFRMTITANHGGYMQVYICDERLGPQTPDPEGPNGCLSRWLVENPSGGTRWNMPSGSGDHTFRGRIPQGLQCDSCTLQWRWWTNVGTGEMFRNCADVRVLGSGSPGPSPTPTPTPTPVPTPVPSPMPPATTTRAPAPAGSCVQNTDCAANAWCNDPGYVRWCQLHSAAQCPSPQCMLASAVPSPAPTPSTTPAPATTTKTTRTTTMPVQTTAAPTPAPMPASCADCRGENACIWTDGICYPSVAQEACEGTVGAMWCGTPAPAPPAPGSPCASCRGEHACIWSDGLCYPRVAREACEGTQGATWCGAGSEPEPESEPESEPEPEPEPVNMYEQVEGVGAWGGYCTCPDGQRYNVGDKNDGCAAGPSSLACVGGTPGECMQQADEARRGMQVTCAPTPEPASAMQVVPHGPPAARRKISPHRQGFLATALLQAAAALERVAGVRDGGEEL